MSTSLAPLIKQNLHHLVLHRLSELGFPSAPPFLVNPVLAEVEARLERAATKEIAGLTASDIAIAFSRSIKPRRRRAGLGDGAQPSATEGSPEGSGAFPSGQFPSSHSGE